MLTQLTTLVPLAGAFGALVGVLVTQLATGRREKRQWKRQQEADDRRWKREREERTEQWNREDAARWERERFGAYSEVLGKTEKWLNVARKEKPLPSVGRRSLSEAGAARLDVIAEEVDEAIISIELLAPERIRGPARSIYVDMTMYTLNFATFLELTEDATDDEEIKRHSDEAVRRIWSRNQSLRKLIRTNLGITTPEEEGNTSEE